MITDTKIPFNSLSNHFLIAMPQLRGSYFANSLIYLWSHSEQGALGIVINLPMKITISEVFEQLDIPDQRLPDSNQTVLSGGPIETEKGFILHDAKNHWDSTISVSEKIHVTTSKDILADIAHGSGPDNYLFALGCSGWDSGQLEKEILANSWLTCPATKDIIFSTDFANKPNLATTTMGFDLAQLNPDIGLGQLN